MSFEIYNAINQLKFSSPKILGADPAPVEYGADACTLRITSATVLSKGKRTKSVKVNDKLTIVIAGKKLPTAKGDVTIKIDGISILKVRSASASRIVAEAVATSWDNQTNRSVEVSAKCGGKAELKIPLKISGPRCPDTPFADALRASGKCQ